MATVALSKRLRLTVTAVAATLCFSGAALAQFPSSNVTLHMQLDLTALSASSGNDCWGYVSPSGREYALMGVNNALVVVEITTPASPTIVGSVSHTSSSWADIKVFGTHCYVVNESGGGMDVVDLSNIDAATNRVTLVQRMTTGGLSRSHNVAINEDSGFLYLIGSNLNGGAPVVYSLANPAAPVEVGRWTEPSAAYHHDAHIVSYTSGPYAGREILFGFSEGRGVDIVDVTDKGNIFLMSRTAYPGVQYCHQGWTTPDRKYLFANDELDEINGTTPTTRTLIFDISDLNNPTLPATYTTGLQASDHNMYVNDCILWAANYTSGLRILNISNPLAPVEVGFFDTFPANNSAGTTALWSVYPYFPSGTVILSDMIRGLFIIDPSAAVAASDAIPGDLVFTFDPNPPTMIEAAGGTTVNLEIAGACDTVLDTSTAMFHYDLGGGFTSVPMTEVTSNSFEAVFPAVSCEQNVPYYFSAQAVGGGTWTSPVGAPGNSYSATGVGPANVLWEDNYQMDKGWTATVPGGATSGNWQRGEPVNDPNWDFDPFSDSDGSGQCYLTQNQNGNTDVDGGAVQLDSPVIDMTGDDIVITYDYYLRLTVVDGIDKLLVEINTNGGVGSFTEIARHDTDGGTSWRSHTITQGDLDTAGVTLNANMVVRFTANDDGDASIVEAGLDAFAVTSFTCATAGDGDFDVDGDVDLFDFGKMQECWGEVGVSLPCLPGDLTGDDAINADDFTAFNLVIVGP